MSGTNGRLRTATAAVLLEQAHFRRDPRLLILGCRSAARESGGREILHPPVEDNHQLLGMVFMLVGNVITGSLFAQV
jgi:hypothetical protein